MREKSPIRKEFQNKNFANKGDEANWWDSQPAEKLSEEFLRAAAEGVLRQSRDEETKEPEARS